MINADKKRTLILEAATRRFAHFGLTKTTMAEIAKDLSFSKALLYYYFPDKNSLYAAVLEHVMRKTFQEIEAGLSAINDCEEAMMYMLDKRIAFITKYYTLLEYSMSAVQQMPDEMACVMGEAKDEEIELISAILRKGNGNGQLKVDDVAETAEIILYALVGMRFSVLSDIKGLLFPTKEEFDRILTLQKKMAIILLKGLRA
ncbi:TetR/AcrR family transcriptional regulator [Parapedobacter lycopersici]|uniref:TetR/AcrR family transcriptional regulator n=1 Tax=Parapedobacter lycopersici TaxID=1864939 RepID=UPI00214DD701|nr:TetR/AcrR family transcriptional regulator [Parapedobacter lycopersici]